MLAIRRFLKRRTMRRLLFLFAICISISATAQDFKILFVNTETVSIGGKDLVAGDVFNQSDTIQWSDAKQAIKALSLSDNKQYVFVSTDFKERKLKSAKDYLVKSNRLSTRGSGSLSSVERQIGETLYVIDSTEVSINYEPDESEYFFLLLDGNRFELSYKEGRLVFTPVIWTGKDEPITVDLLFHYADGYEECVIEELSIIPLPSVIMAD
jgi:hypothetical protein